MDGCWPIDTNLATWVTTWSIHALRWQDKSLCYENRSALRDWLLGQQYRKVHPYTNAAPGGWAWTDLPGGVPDADDTPGALVALLELGVVDGTVRKAGLAGVKWLMDLQNSDGGIPTFCRGWGTLPFDRSSPDLTAHTLRAWNGWITLCDKGMRHKCNVAMGKGLEYLKRTQRADGGWVPLWFGNEQIEGEENVTYGTSRVLLALRELRNAGRDIDATMKERAEKCLVSLQLESGGWAGGLKQVGKSELIPSVEETSLAVEALAGTQYGAAADRGAAWLVEQVESGTWTKPAPIGFYFAKLWYFEALYPVALTVSALGAALRFSEQEQAPK